MDALVNGQGSACRRQFGIEQVPAAESLHDCDPDAEPLYSVIIYYTGERAFLTLSGSMPRGREGAEALAEAFDFAAACEGQPDRANRGQAGRTPRRPSPGQP